VTESSKLPGEIVVHVFGRTDVGRTREHNEDAFIVADLTTMNATLQPEVRRHVPGERGTLFMVADGMGGAAAGEVASAMATDIVLTELDLRWRKAGDATPESFARALKAATEAANARIHKYAAEHPENRGMGTTATVAGILGDTLYLTQVGDSRGYLVRAGKARQITKDQSLMQKLIEAGELTEEEAEVSERKNIILQALGPEPQVKVDLTSQQVRHGDTLILCSDGMSGQMRADDIARIVNEDPDLVATCRKLIDLANENGGPDNITVIAARFEGAGLQAPGDGELPAHQVYASEGEDLRLTVPIAAPPKAAEPPAGGRVPVPMLRVIFGLVAIALAVYLIAVAFKRG
jgi:serine/threonine protein phosphatase PrpC